MDSTSAKIQSLKLGAFIIWTLLLFILSAGIIFPPFWEISNDKNRRELPKAMKRKPTFGKMYKFYLWAFGNFKAFPGFHMILFAVGPIAVAVLAKRALDDEVESAFFFFTDELRDLKTEQILLWEVVYCFCGCMFAIMLNYSQMLPHKLDSDKPFQILPVQYHKKMFDQFAIIGSILLLGASRSAAKVFVSLDNDEIIDEKLGSLLKGSITAPFALLVGIGYEGLARIFVSLYGFDGVFFNTKYIFYILGRISALLVVKFLAGSNDIAKRCLFSSGIVFVVLPIAFWFLSFSRAEIPPGTENRRAKYDFYGNKSVVGVYNRRFNLLGEISKLGLKHWIWTPAKPFYTPFSAYFLTLPTENNNVGMLYTKSVYFTPVKYDVVAHLNIYSVVASQLYAIPIMSLLITFGLQFAQRDLCGAADSDDVALDLSIISPAMGRSVYQYLNKYTQIIYFVDGPGHLPALAYFNEHVKKATEDVSQQKVFFIFKCYTLGEYCLLAHGLEETLMEFGTSSIGEENIDFMILLEGKDSSVVFYTYSEETVIRRLISRKATTVTSDFSCVNLDDMLDPRVPDKKQSAVIAIGTSYTNSIVKAMAESKRSEIAHDFYDVVIEDSVYRKEEYCSGVLYPLDMPLIARLKALFPPPDVIIFPTIRYEIIPSKARKCDDLVCFSS